MGLVYVESELDESEEMEITSVASIGRAIGIGPLGKTGRVTFA